MGNKRPLEAIDANARSSNSSGDSKTIARASKRPKSTHKSVEAALARARDVCTTMLPSADARRKTIDLSIFAKGTVERIHHNAANETVTCFLLSDNAPSVPYAELPVVFKGPWVNAHLNHGVLSENTSIVLAFKEARIGYGQTEQGPSDNNQAPFGVYLLFDRGVEFWITSEPLCIATGITASAASDWKHFKLFAQAQQTKTNAPLPRSDNERLAGEVVDEGPLASSVLTKSSEAIMQIQPAQIPAAAQQTEFQEQNTEEEECLPSPPTGITQIEAGSPSRATNVEVEDEGDAALAVMKNAKVRLTVAYPFLLV